MKFLTARWEHLLLANYSVTPDRLAPFVPRRTVLDEFDGHAFVSLVAFLFNRTRVLGLPVPGHTRFEEVNLRFYVTPDNDPDQRAVTFIKEIVPRRAIPLIANRLFHENYVALPMRHRNELDSHSYSWGPNFTDRFTAKVDSELVYPEAGSIDEFITEHYWGYAGGGRRTLEYRVEHPQWRCRRVVDYEIDVDFAANYGEEFRFLSTQEPHSVLYAEGSEVSVSFPRRL